MNLFDFVGVEDFFKINLIGYELEGNVAKLVQRSSLTADKAPAMLAREKGLVGPLVKF